MGQGFIKRGVFFIRSSLEEVVLGQRFLKKRVVLEEEVSYHGSTVLWHTYDPVIYIDFTDVLSPCSEFMSL